MNELSRRLLEPVDSDDHQFLRDELCNARMLGNDGLSRYFISVLSETDQLGLRDNGFLQVAEGLAKAISGEAANAFIYTEESVVWMWPLFEYEYRNRYSNLGLSGEWSKCNEAARLRLMHPELDDDAIADLVPTPAEQLRRCSDYKYLARFLI